MATNNEKAISTLNDLIEYCRDGQYGYKSAANDVKNHELKNMFNNYTQQRAKFASELEQQVRDLGGNPTSETGHELGALHRGWMDFQSAVSQGNEDSMILAECERGETTAISAYETAMKEQLPAEVTNVLRRQHSQIKDAFNRIHNMHK